MASSELDFEPDIKKAPPHVEGELLKQNTKSRMGFKNWKKFYFIVLKDKLQYFDKREDSKQNKEAVAFLRMSQVTSITEVVFSGVPHKHHLNCGFSLEAFHPNSQQPITLNLLAETPEDMRYWVHALRYIKGYWSKMMIRETVLSDEQERRILQKILSNDGAGDGANNDDEAIPGNYSLDEEGGGRQNPPGDDGSYCLAGSAISIYFDDNSKVKVHLLPSETTSDLLEKEEVKEHLSSSSAHVWLVDSLGNDMLLGPDDHPGLFPGKTQKLFALDYAHRVLPVFYNKKEFECLVVPSTVTATQIIEHHDVSVKLDLTGVTNRGLFLKSDVEELMFTGVECPCEVLFDANEEGLNIARQPVGKLVIHNKVLGGGRGFNLTKRLKNKRTVHRPNRRRKESEEHRHLEDISQEEQAQSNALDMLMHKKKIIPIINEGDVSPKDSSLVQTDLEIDGEHWVNMSTEEPTPKSKDGADDSRGLEDAVHVGAKGSLVSPERNGSAPTHNELRNRSHAVSNNIGPVKARGQSASYKNPSPSLSSPVRPRSRSKSPKRRLPEAPTSSPLEKSPPSDDLSSSSSSSSSLSVQQSSPFTRRGATRSASISKGVPTTKMSPPLAPLTSPDPIVKSKPISFSSLSGKGPTIRFSDQRVSSSIHPSSSSSSTPSSSSSSVMNGGGPSPRIHMTRSKSPSFRGSDNFSINPGESRSSAFGLTPAATSDRPKSADSELASSSSSSLASASTSQVEIINRLEDTPTTQREGSPVKLRPFVIDFKALQVAQEEKKEESTSSKPLPINVTSPSFLKIVLLQSSEAGDVTEETKPMDLISLSGVALRNHRGVWSLEEGSNFHDDLPYNCDDHTEIFRLPGGIRAVYNHTHKRWHVLASSQPTPVHAENVESAESSEHAQETTQDRPAPRALLSGDALYLSKKVVVTEVGSAFHAIMNLFGKTRDNIEKKRIGSDMTNPTIGHLIRGRFCSAIARIMLDGLRPYRLQGMIQDNIWKVTTAFCSAAQTDPTSSLVTPSIDKLIFQPIHALKAEMRDDNIKFRTFISLSISKGMLTGWLEALPKQKSVLNKFYLPSAFLCLVNEGSPSYSKLYLEMLLTLEPMLYLPFDLSIDFETRQSAPSPSREQGGLGGAGGGEATQSPTAMHLSPSSSSMDNNVPSSPSQNSLRPNVVIKKVHAATGQRTSSGNIINAVWDTSPLHTHDNTARATSPAPKDHVDGKGEALTKVLYDSSRRSPSSVTNQHAGAQSHDQSRDQSSTIATPVRGGGGGGGGKKFSIFKKFSESLQQLNMGGAITGAPPRGTGQLGNDPASKQKPVSEPVKPKPMPATGEWHVEALHTNICDDNDELCFNKGDLLLVKEQINSEWLICSLGNKTGIVPVNYIKSLS